MIKVLVTGSNGFIGHYLVKELLENGFEVLATGKGICRVPFKHQHFSYRTLDFTNHEAVTHLVNEQKPAVIIHCGAMSKPDECELNKEAAFRTNVTGSLYLLDAAKAVEASFLFLSTDFVFDGKKGMYREEDARDPVNYYGQTKLMAEDEVMKYKGSWSIVRTVLVYGNPIQNRDNILTHTVKNLQKGEKLRIFNDQVRTPTYVEDLAKGIVAILQKREQGIFHISGEEVWTPYEMAIAAARHTGLDDSLIEPIQEGELVQPARRPLKTGFDISRAKRLLGYLPISFREGLEKTFS